MTPESTAESPIPIYINARAGMGGEGEAEIEREARALGVPVDIRVIEPGRLAAELGRALEESVPVVGVAGGDGSLRTAANVLCGTGTILAPIPAGTLNRFARRLGIFSTNQALHWISKGASERVAVGFVDDEPFLNTAIFGFYSEVVRKRERLRPWLTKWLAAAVTGTLVMARAPLIDITIELEGAGTEKIRRTTPMIWIGLGGGSFPFVHAAPRPHGPDLLEVAIIRSTTRRGMTRVGLGLAAQVLRRRRPIRVPKVELFHASQVILQSRGRVGATLDGEPSRLAPPILVRAEEAMLAVVAAPEPDRAEAEDRPAAPEGLTVPFDSEIDV